MTTTLVISPCPNDTFVFHALVHGRAGAAPCEASRERLSVRYADIDVCNAIAVAGEADVVKVSVAALPWLLESYEVLDSGGAVGHGCGPLVLTRPEALDEAERRSDAAPDVPRAPPAWLAGTTIAVPGERTTAYLLLRLWLEGHLALDAARVVVMPFEQIMPAVRDGAVGAGLVIHEARFTYPDHRLVPLVDLGAWWEADTGLPVPLGVIVARRDGSLAPDVWSRAVRASVEAAWADPGSSRAYVREHAQETAPDVVARHIATYVNGYTRSLGADGRSAIDTLLGRAARSGLVPPAPSVV